MSRWIWLFAVCAACGSGNPAAPEDADGDGFTADEDCDDRSADVFPGADELCNQIDDDCDGETDEDALNPTTWYLDGDQDGYGVDDDFVQACEQPAGRVDAAGDCDDEQSDIHPDANDDPCSGVDEDCDGASEVHVPSDYATLQAAADATNEGDIICVGPGVWAAVSITHALTVISTDGAASTTLDGAGAGRVVEVVGAPGTRLVDLTITGGTAPLSGGAIYVSESSDTEILDCLIDDNQSSGRAVVTISSSDRTAVRGTVLSNNTGSIGGALHVLDSSGVTIESCDFDNNQATLGGAVQVSGVTDLDVIDCELTGNSATQGGGMSISDDSAGVHLSEITFSGNSATGAGGAIHATASSDLSVTDSDFGDDAAGNAGGGYFEEIASLTLESNTFARETFSGVGAGTLDLIDCTTAVLTGNVVSASPSAASITGGENVTLSLNTWELNSGASTLGASGVAGLTLSHETFRDNAGAGFVVQTTSGLVIEDSAFARNGSGGLEVSDLDALVMRRTTFTDNTDDHSGGAAVSDVLQVEIDTCTFTGNQASIPSALNGDTGGLAVTGANLVTIRDCELRDNVAEGTGGGLTVTTSTSVTLTDTMVIGNEAETGGGIYFLSIGNAVVSGGHVATNTASAGGGGVQCVSSTLELSGANVHSNSPDNVACDGCSGCTDS